MLKVYLTLISGSITSEKSFLLPEQEVVMLGVEHLKYLMKLLNDNQGVVTLIIFILTIILGWLSGIFSVLRMQPKLVATLLPGPTLSCTFATGRTFNGHDTHRTAIALYLQISNLGFAPTDIAEIWIGYHKAQSGHFIARLYHSMRWIWLRDQIISLEDFQTNIGGCTKVYPFLRQRNNKIFSENKTYLRAGEKTNGIVYFEQKESWGDYFPRTFKGSTKIKICLIDIHSTKFTSIHRIPTVNLEEAAKYNSRFGQTFAEFDTHETL